MINEGLSQIVICIATYNQQRQDKQVTIAKVQPPDGMVIQMADGSRWSLMAHRSVERGQENPILLDPDCRAGKHAACIGDPCECRCHREQQ